MIREIEIPCDGGSCRASSSYILMMDETVVTYIFTIIVCRIYRETMNTCRYVRCIGFGRL